jgi:hypothetical protein
VSWYHSLVRAGQPEPRIAERRQERPLQRYRCSCDPTPLLGGSRREARIDHQAHRAEVGVSSPL